MQKDAVHLSKPIYLFTYMCIIFLLTACLCVHVLESRPSLVALCLRDGSVYMKSS